MPGMSNFERIDSFRGSNFFLSNFFEDEFTVPTLGTVPSSEHAFNALKTRDPNEQEYVLSASSPGEAKRRGRSVTLRDDWDVGGRVRAMQVVLQYKFGSRRMRELLLGTGTAALVEGNSHHDNFWGDCRCGGRRCAAPGVNALGELLMAERAKDGRLR
ncbi:hypothetical protein GSI01S_34_00510 [Gordonia sihwensis NBRC 108236]|uniref:NADAR domain-containing protein n=2 Tax=Gordonia TaxID=2053 RepID=L7LNH9_9ACTN|nr:hypothetical protein GSI01S_34_00510 [Gordonia sihwensis NBRC 108236]